MVIVLEITVIPLSGKNECIVDENGQIKWYLKSAPEKGKANQELIRSIADLFHIPQYTISLATGATGRKKRVKIETNLSKEELVKQISERKKSDR